MFIAGINIDMDGKFRVVKFNLWVNVYIEYEEFYVLFTNLKFFGFPGLALHVQNLTTVRCRPRCVPRVISRTVFILSE